MAATPKTSWLDLLISNPGDLLRAGRTLTAVMERGIAANMHPVLATSGRLNGNTRVKCVPFSSVRCSFRRWRLFDLPHDAMGLMWHLALFAEDICIGDPLGKAQILLGYARAKDYIQAVKRKELRLERDLFVNSSYWEKCVAVMHPFDPAVSIEFQSDYQELLFDDNPYIRILDVAVASDGIRELLWEWK